MMPLSLRWVNSILAISLIFTLALTRLKGSGKFEVAGHARDGEEAVVVWAARNGLLDDYRHGPSSLHLHRAPVRLPDGEGVPRQPYLPV